MLGNVGRMHLSAYTGVGGGSLHSQATGTLPYLYVQPTATVGWSAGRVGVEVGPYLRVPFYVLDDRGPVVVSASAPTVGGQVSLLFGNWNRRKATVAAPAPVVQPYPPAPPYAPAPPPPPRPPGGPLAIPGGAPPPLEGPR